MRCGYWFDTGGRWRCMLKLGHAGAHTSIPFTLSKSDGRARCKTFGRGADEGQCVLAEGHDGRCSFVRLAQRPCPQRDCKRLAGHDGPHRTGAGRWFGKHGGHPHVVLRCRAKTCFGRRDGQCILNVGHACGHVYDDGTAYTCDDVRCVMAAEHKGAHRDAYGNEYHDGVLWRERDAPQRPCPDGVLRTTRCTYTFHLGERCVLPQGHDGEHTAVPATPPSPYRARRHIEDAWLRLTALHERLRRRGDDYVVSQVELAVGECKRALTALDGTGDATGGAS